MCGLKVITLIYRESSVTLLSELDVSYTDRKLIREINEYISYLLKTNMHFLPLKLILFTCVNYIFFSNGTAWDTSLGQGSAKSNGHL